MPDPPPPRPERREAAINAALRRFDGVEDAPAAERPPRRASVWSGRPQLAMAMSIALIAAVGLPATWIAIRDGALNTEPPRSPPKGASRPASRYAPPPAARGAEAASAELAAADTKEFPALPRIPAERRNAPSPAANEPALDEAVAAPPPAIAAAPPPPPPPAPAAEEKKVAQGVVANTVVVTGSRVAQPNLPAKSDYLSRQTAGRAEEADAQTAHRVLNDSAYAAFLGQLQTAVRGNDREGVIKLIAFPLRVNFDKSRIYRDAKSVRRDYDIIFTPHVRQAILSQRADRLFTRDLGVMVGNGEVWFDHVCADESCSRLGPVRITAINR